MIDVIILGGSFAGLSAALQLARARRPVLVIDHDMPRNRFSDASHGFLGHDGKSPRAIVEEALTQLRRYPAFRRLAGEAVSAKADGNGFVVTLADGREFVGAKLILATGVHDTLPLPGMDERWGQSVLPCPYCHGYEVADQPLGVLAVSPMSAHQAALLPDWGPTTYFTQGEYLPDADESMLLERRGVTVEHTPVIELLGPIPKLEAVRLADGRTLPLHALFTGSRTALTHPIADQLGCATEDGPWGPYLRVDAMKQTNVPGVFAAGDAATAMYNASMAAAAGTMAGVCAHRSLVME
ncbi:MAG: NAD(P)/FAD-dependent oxidoreductase [Rhodanobacter sp.]